MEKCKKCGQCGYFMRYVRYDGTPDHDGDCANLKMNKECNESKVDPFLPWAIDEGYTILQVGENETACCLFRIDRTPRVRRLIKRLVYRYQQLRK